MMRNKPLPIVQLQKQLAVIWGVTFILGVVIMLVLNERLGGAMAQGWGWFSQTFVPTMAVISAGLIKSQKTKDKRRVDLFFCRFASVALLFYALVVLAIPFLIPKDMPLMTWLSNSAIFLGLFQGGVVGFVTFAFGKEETGTDKAGSGIVRNQA